MVNLSSKTVPENARFIMGKTLNVLSFLNLSIILIGFVMCISKVKSFETLKLLYEIKIITLYGTILCIFIALQLY